MNFNTIKIKMTDSELSDRLTAVEAQLKELTSSEKESFGKVEKVKSKSTKERTPRAPTKYNKFMSKYISEQKETLGTEFNHKMAFSGGAKKWNEQKELS